MGFSNSRSVSARRVALVALGSIILIVLLIQAVTWTATSALGFAAFETSNNAWAAQVSDSVLYRLSATSTSKFQHEQSAHLPRDPVAERQCAAIPSWKLQDLAISATLTSTSDPIFFHFHNGELLTDTSTRYTVSDEFCSVFFVPQNARSNSSQFENLPIGGWGPDSIHAELMSDDVRLVFQHPHYWGVSTIAASHTASSWQQPVTMAIYTTAYALNHPGSYQITGEVEFDNYDWVMEDPIDLTKEFLPYHMFNHTLQPRSPAVVVEGKPVSRPTAWCYHDGNIDLHGRWYLASSFSATGNQTAMNPEAHVEFAEHNNTVDEWGWTFAPDACNIAYFSPENHLTCLADRTIQVLGDSNSRRVMKSIMGGGIAWCQNSRDHICQCEDHFQTSFQDVLFNEINASNFREIERRTNPTVFGRNSKVYFDFVGGLLNAKLFNHWKIFFDSEPDRPSRVAQRMNDHGPIDVVHVSLIGWDMASIRTPSEVVAALPAFRDMLQSAYPAGTRFIHRLANNMCCGNQNHKTRYSAPRFAIWNAMWRSFWAEDEQNDIIRIVDPSVLQGRRDAETAFFCPTTHLRTSHVRLEQMMWMTAACERPASEGAAKMRDWGLK